MLQELGMKFFDKGDFKINYGYHRFNKRREFESKQRSGIEIEVINLDQIITWKEKINSLSNTQSKC